MGTWSNSWLAIFENLADNFFWSCGCIAFNTSSPFSRKNRFVASAKNVFFLIIKVTSDNNWCRNSYSIFCCFWTPLQYSFEPFLRSNSILNFRHAWKYPKISVHSILFLSSQQQHHLKNRYISSMQF